MKTVEEMLDQLERICLHRKMPSSHTRKIVNDILDRRLSDRQMGRLCALQDIYSL